jgi:hypothetical protein
MSFSGKVDSLLSFLDDLDKNASGNELDGVPQEGKLKEETDSGPPLSRVKKYIWDDWEETAQDGDVTLLDIQQKMAPREHDVENIQSKSVPAAIDVRRQLLQLKAMSQEIQTRASSMTVELEYKTKKLEELHTLRVRDADAHVQKMKSSKQEWKKRHEDAREEHDKHVNELENTREALALSIPLLQRQIYSLQAEILKTTTSENEIRERLNAEGARELENERVHWQMAERNELQMRDKRISSKLKQDAAKAIEPKLRQMMEGHKEELERIEKVLARELDFYRLELYKRANEEFRKESNTIREEEKSRSSHLEKEWTQKLENARKERENELWKVREEYEQRRDEIKKQFKACKQKRIEDHQTDLTEVKKLEDLEMEQIRARHEKSLGALEVEYKARAVQQQKSFSKDFEKWKLQREEQLLNEEAIRINEEVSKMTRKAQADVDKVKKKLDNERVEKSLEEKKKRADQDAAIEERLEQSKREATTLVQKEGDESRQLEEQQDKLAGLLEAVSAGEAELISQQKRLASLEVEHVECALGTTSRKEQYAKEIADLKTRHDEELKLAKSKVNVMLTQKNESLREAESKLMSLRNNALTIEKDLVEARKKKLLLQTPVIEQVEENSTNLCIEERQEIRQDSTAVKSLITKSLIPKKLKHVLRVKKNKY